MGSSVERGVRAGRHETGPAERAPLPAAGIADRMLGLQRSAGNAAVAGLVAGPAGCPECSRPLSPAPLGLQRGIGDDIIDAVADALDVRENEADLDAMEDYEDALEEKQEWIAEGVRGPKNVRAPTGLGGFGAKYDPDLNELTITLAGGVTFTDGLSIDGSGNVTANQPSGPAAAVVTQIMAAPVEQRAALVAPWQWATDSAGKTAFLADFTSTVQSKWSDKFTFHCSKRYWEDMGAIVNVVVSIHEGAKAGDEHMSLTVYKVPSNFVGGVGVVWSRKGPTNNTMTLNSNDVSQRRDNLLVPSPVTFAEGQSELTDAGKAAVKYVANVFQAANPTCGTCGRAVPGVDGPVLTILCEGDLNVNYATEEEEAEERDRIARERYLAIVLALIDAGFSNANDRVTMVLAHAPGRTCRITAESGVAQVVAEHEAGHMFGLGDEYATSPGGIRGTGPAAGGKTSHDQLAKDMGLEGAVAENNDNIMSIGGVVRPQHYSTFFWALKEVSGMDEWALGPPTLVSPPGGAKPSGGPGDYPMPADGDTAVA